MRKGCLLLLAKLVKHYFVKLETRDRPGALRGEGPV